MISKNKLKLIRSLAKKKYREKEKLFLTEGDKNVLEVLTSNFVVRELFATPEFLFQHAQITKKARLTIEVGPDEIKKASLLQTPQNCLALCEIPQPGTYHPALKGLVFYFDGIQDPGNLGTIIRTCDWFGIDEIFCSADTVDFYNPKVIQATMGSFCRVRVLETEFTSIATAAKKAQVPIYGSFMDGNSVYSQNLPENALVVLGNEGNGIRPETENMIDWKISIPSFSNSGTESLNVGVAAGIICSEFKRRLI